ncbi:hypothetical protein KFE25_003501 [Diacronema lutheri]|uniref:Uncharacterized protein n=1 Tax=Diacronema lutheri TaxID=2081491 RepID=A0A8J6CEC9_DIALT|nr:hypothetical protein KFE25_003501 [Diacronema lutheri]
MTATTTSFINTIPSSHGGHSPEPGPFPSVSMRALVAFACAARSTGLGWACAPAHPTSVLARRFVRVRSAASAPLRAKHSGADGATGCGPHAAFDGMAPVTGSAGADRLPFEAAGEDDEESTSAPVAAIIEYDADYDESDLANGSATGSAGADGAATAETAPDPAETEPLSPPACSTGSAGADQLPRAQD